MTGSIMVARSSSAHRLADAEEIPLAGAIEILCRQIDSWITAGFGHGLSIG
jgi:hypothetical protein